MLHVAVEAEDSEEVVLSVQGWIADDETVVLFNTGSGLKYAHLWM